MTSATVQTGDLFRTVMVIDGPNGGPLFAERAHLPGSTDDITGTVKDSNHDPHNGGERLYYGKLSEAVAAGHIDVGMLLEILDEKLSVLVNEISYVAPATN
jgi:hypothetical protein